MVPKTISRENHNLGSMVDETSVESLIAALGDKDGLKRHSARVALVAIGRPAVQALIVALCSPDPNVRWEAAKALAEIRDPAAAPALVDRLSDRRPGVRWIAAEGLTAMGHNALVPLYYGLIKRSGSIWFRQGAHHILHDLAQQGLKDEVKPVLKALEDLEPELEAPQAARVTLDQMGVLHRPEEPECPPTR